MPDAFTVSTTPTYSNFLTKLIAAQLLSKLRGGLIYGPAGAVNLNTYKTGTNDTYVYGQVPDLTAVVPAPMDELVPPTVELVQSVTAEFSTVEYARSVGFSSKLLRQQTFGPAQAISELVGRNAAELIDLTLKAEWGRTKSGEVTIGDGTANATTAMLANALAYLQDRDVPPLASGFYGVLCSPWLINDLKAEVGDRAWTAAQLENPVSLETGSLGRWQGFEFFGSSLATPASGTEQTAIVTGASSIALADLSSLASYLVLPTASVADPVAQKGIASYRIRLGAQAIARIKRQGDTTPIYSHVKLRVKLNKATVVVTP